VGVQAGHWNIEELPDELERLRSSTGARFRDLQEAQLNLGIARRVAALLQAAGVAVDLLPATVPAGYTADAFVSIHADGAARAGVRGWKAAASWRASAAGRRLRDAIAETYARYTGLPEDRFGTTFNMKGYYAFSPHRARHAISQHTPAVIIETGFLTVREDREVLASRPEDVARGIAFGVLLFLGRYDPFDREALAVPAYPIMRVAVQRVPLAVQPDPEGRTAGELTEGTLVRPMYRSNGWVEVVVWGNFHVFGWLPEKSLEPLPGAS
jgi:N-acetylmuramoyl-L-alanine amidase